jgi:hypothetical protein
MLDPTRLGQGDAVGPFHSVDQGAVGRREHRLGA